MSLPVWGEWIEIKPEIDIPIKIKVSLPMRGEWIEISSSTASISVNLVSPHAGRVD